MNALILAILLQGGSNLIPLNEFRAAAVQNPSIAYPVPKNLQKDYDKLWKRFVAAPAAKEPAKEDAKVSAEFDKLLKKNPDTVAAMLVQAYIDLYSGQQARAEQRLEAVLAKRPSDRVALFHLAESAYARNEYVRASGLYRRLKAVDNSRQDVDLKAQRALLLGMQSLVQEAANAARTARLAEAERLYRQALELAPDEAALHGQLAAVLVRLGKTDEANAALRRQIELGGAGEEARRALDNSYQAQDARREQASAELRDLGRWGNQIERLKEIRTSQAINREQLAGLLARYFPQLLEFPKSPQIMTDLANSWAAPAIDAVVGVGLLDPTANHTFQPARTVSRGEFAQVMSRLIRKLGLLQRDLQPIAAPDLVPGSALYRELQLVLGYGLLSLDNTGNFNLSAPVSGEEAVNTAEKLLRLIQQKAA
jgi:tetratricopeptide (TPR) repeat protein